MKITISSESTMDLAGYMTGVVGEDLRTELVTGNKSEAEIRAAVSAADEAAHAAGCGPLPDLIDEAVACILADREVQS